MWWWSEELIGRVIDPLGRPLDGKAGIISAKRLPIERKAPDGSLTARLSRVLLQTGIKAIDTLIPIGRGQRELILGDRQTGKTAIALDTILNQRGENVLCVYCAIGVHASGTSQDNRNTPRGVRHELHYSRCTEGDVHRAHLHRPLCGNEYCGIFHGTGP